MRLWILARTLSHAKAQSGWLPFLRLLARREFVARLDNIINDLDALFVRDERALHRIDGDLFKIG